MSKHVNKKVMVNNEVVNEAINKADALVSLREDWEKEIQQRSNKMLYTLLAEIYALYKKMEEGNCVDEAVKGMRVKLRERGERVQSNSPVFTILIRYVFGCDRQRAYNYAQVLEAAQEREIAAEDMADFIAQNNGVEALKKSRVEADSQTQAKEDQSNARKEQLTAAQDAVRTQLESMQARGTVTLEQDEVVFESNTQFAFLVARQVGKGEFEVLRAVSTTTLNMERMMLMALASEVVAQQAQQTLVDNSDLSGSARDSSGQASKLDEAMKAARAGLTKIDTLTSSNDELADVAA